LIVDPERWFEFLAARNALSRVYRRVVAEKVFETAKVFYPEALAFLDRMKSW
jgi:hypothetical protein